MSFVEIISKEWTKERERIIETEQIIRNHITSDRLRQRGILSVVLLPSKAIIKSRLIDLVAFLVGSSSSNSLTSLV